MRVLVYNELRPDRIPGFKKTYDALARGDFNQADVRKIGENLYRARLNKSDRLLFTFHRAGGEKCCLLLEHIRNHAYDKSRFLARGTEIDENKIPACTADQVEPGVESPHLNPAKPRFNLLDKVISFDDDQEWIYELPAPLIVVGSAGSGKTALALEKMKQIPGDILYVSLSSYLVENARNLYYAHNYSNDAQEAAFLSFQEFLESVQVPEGRPVTAHDFETWFARQPEARKLRDPHSVFEEIRGVITGALGANAWLSREEYCDLGVKQSIFNDDDRERVYDLFEKYLHFLDRHGLYDVNIVSHKYVEKIRAYYDFVVIDEIQDITNVQLYLLLMSLNTPGGFILTGDSNQIVHPNFFSWGQVKSLFFKDYEIADDNGGILRILHNNYRNAGRVAEIANRILKLKQARFGSVDRESNYLLHSVSEQDGQIQLLDDTAAIKQELDTRTAGSAHVAVLVMHPDQKEAARQWFSTPLIFSVQEAKGLEYDSVVLYNFISDETSVFNTICDQVAVGDLEKDTLDYARPRDKRDKSLETYKFYVNALYVALTRAVNNVYWVETDQDHPAIRVLDLTRYADAAVGASTQQSSTEEWQQEAHRLEKQGKTEQARAIQERILQHKPVPWSVIGQDAVPEMVEQARTGTKKQRLQALEYALLHWHRPILTTLVLAQFKPALASEQEAMEQLHRNHFNSYEFKNISGVLRDVDAYGPDHRTPFNLTPLMIAARVGNPTLAEGLVKRGADPTRTANHGFMALHFALERALSDDKFANRRLPELYPALAPSSIDVQVRGRLIKLDPRHMEYVLFHIMSALFYRHLGPQLGWRVGYLDAFTAKDLADLVEHLPESVLPARRKKRQYISSILSKNEVNGNDRYNRMLFRRLRHGNYIIDPDLKVRVGGEWWRYYDLFRPEDWGPSLREIGYFQGSVDARSKLDDFEMSIAKQRFDTIMLEIWSIRAALFGDEDKCQKPKFIST